MSFFNFGFGGNFGGSAFADGGGMSKEDVAALKEEMKALKDAVVEKKAAAAEPAAKWLTSPGNKAYLHCEQPVMTCHYGPNDKIPAAGDVVAA